MKTINYQMLKDKNACPEHLSLFRDMFGEGDVALSKENLKIARDAKLGVSFLEWFLSDTALAEYNRARVEAVIEYYRVCDEAQVEYKRVGDEAWAEYYRVRFEALIEILSRD